MIMTDISRIDLMKILVRLEPQYPGTDSITTIIIRPQRSRNDKWVYIDKPNPCRWLGLDLKHHETWRRWKRTMTRDPVMRSRTRSTTNACSNLTKLKAHFSKPRSIRLKRREFMSSRRMNKTIQSIILKTSNSVMNLKINNSKLRMSWQEGGN